MSFADASSARPWRASPKPRPRPRRMITRGCAAIAALPPDHGSAVALFYLEEMSVAEVAVALNVPAGTVKTRLMHARRKLRAALEGDE